MEFSQLIIKTDPQLKNQFKATCSIQGLQMQQVINEFIREYVKKAKKQGKLKDSKQV